MLITKQQIADAMDLNVPAVRTAMYRGGYPDSDNEIKSAEFLGVNAQFDFVYGIAFLYEGEIDNGQVYLKFVRDISTQEYQLHGSY